MIPYETLAGRTLVLEPLDASHTPDLIGAALVNQSMFERLRTVHMHSEQEVRDWVSQAIDTARENRCLPYAIIEAASGHAVGAIWFLHISERHRRCEVGWSWLAQAVRNIDMELEAKLVMVEHAVERAGMDRVEFRIDSGDDGGLRLLESFGATPEGVLRDDYVTLDGEVRDTLVFSVLASEWSEVRGRLEERLGRIDDAVRTAALERLADCNRWSRDIEFPLPRS